MSRACAQLWLSSWSTSLLVSALVLSCGTERPPPISATDDSETPDENSDETKPGTSMREPDAGGSDEPSSSGAATVTPAQCDAPTFEDDADAVPFERLSATVVDEEGNPIPDTVAQACGLNICLQSKTDSQGRVTISEVTEIAKVAFKYGDGLHYAQVATLLPNDARFDLGEQTTLRLPAGVAENRIEPGASVTSSEVRLELADASNVKIDRLSYPDESEHVFVAREFEADVLPASIANQDFAAVWVLGPQKTEFCPPAKLTLPNTTDLAPGSGVELYLLVTGIEGHFAPYAEWGKVGTATVSNDGSQIETDPNSGLPELGIIGVRSSVDTDSAN